MQKETRELRLRADHLKKFCIYVITELLLCFGTVSQLIHMI
jgi:hypothetical protein